MSIFNDKALKSVAEAAAKIMAAEGSVPKTPKEKSLAALAHPKDKITHKDVLVGRGVLKKEEQEVELKEAGMPSSVIKHKQNLANMTDQEFAKRHADTSHADLRSMAHRHFGTKAAGPGTRGNEIYVNRVKKGSVQNEEVELDEAFPTVADGEKALRAKEGKTSKGTVAKTKTGLVHTRDYEDEKEEDSATPAKRGRPVKDKFAKKKLGEMRQQFLKYMEEVDNETFTKELKDQEAKMNGKKKGGDVAKPAVQAVKQEEVEQIDEKKGSGESDPLKNRADYAAANKPGQVYKKTYAGDKVGMSKSYAYDIKRTGPKGKLPEEVEQMDEVAPPGREDQVKALKKVPGIDNPYAVSWASYKKSHSKKTKE